MIMMEKKEFPFIFIPDHECKYPEIYIYNGELLYSSKQLLALGIYSKSDLVYYLNHYATKIKGQFDLLEIDDALDYENGEKERDSSMMIIEQLIRHYSNIYPTMNASEIYTRTRQNFDFTIDHYQTIYNYINL